MRAVYLKQIEAALEGHGYDIIGVSAGFDTYIEDWGGLLETEDYEIIGNMIKDGSQKCRGKRFAILEVGYHADLALNIKSFIKGLALKFNSHFWPKELITFKKLALLILALFLK